MKKALLSASAIGRELGLAASTVLKLHADGAIQAEIHEGRLVRFDLDKVRAVLAKRAKRATRTTNQSGMVPTY